MITIEIEKVCVDFSVGHGPPTWVADDTNLRIGADEISGIVGTSDAGKSTLLCTLNTLTRPSQESTKVSGVEISAPEGRHLCRARQRIDVIFQHFSLMYTRTVAQNAAFSLRVAGWERSKTGPYMSETLALAGLFDKANRLPAQLSGGQKQRVSITCAIVNRPDVLLCDEPTSALDLETLATVLTLFRQINQQLGITIVLITHEMAVIKSICDRVAVMSGGRVVESGEIFGVPIHPQRAFMQQLVSYILDLTPPEHLHQYLPGQSPRILLIGDPAKQLILSEVAAKFGATVNILHGKVGYIGERTLRTLAVQLITPHNPSAVEVTVEHIRQRVVQVEVIYG